MTPVEIVSVISKSYPALWKLKARLTNRKLLAMLGLGDPSINEPMLAKALRDPTKAGARIAAAFCEPNNQQIIVTRLGIPNPFDIELESDLHALLWAAGYKTKPSVLPWLVHLTRQNEIDKTCPLAETEQSALKELALVLNTATQPIVHWQASRFCGANFISRAVFPFLDGERYESGYLLSISMLEDPYEPEFTQLKELHAVLGGLDRDIETLVDKLYESRALLTINNFEYFDEDNILTGRNTFYRIVQHIQRHPEKYKRPVMLVVGNGHIQFNRNHVNEIKKLEDVLNISADNRLPYFKTQMEYFHQERTYGKIADDSGFRFKRAQLHFDSQDSAPVWPIDIKLRALFASNRENYAYFDPTGGFKTLVGNLNGKLPVDVRMYQDEVGLYLRSFPPKKKQLEIQVLRWCSTAIYWLTDDAMTLLRTTTNDNSLRKALEKVSDVVSEATSDFGSEPETRIYIAPLALRAIVQDDWKAQEPYDRAISHYRVAQRLFEKQNNKELLAREFPFEPHWGRSRIHFLSECLRHLIRACENVPEDMPSVMPRPFLDGFPPPPLRQIQGSNPHEILEFCYQKIFQEGLNGNSKTERRSRSLSTRHGNYHLVAELLQLLGTKGHICTPHWALPEHYGPKFRDDVGFAKLDLGELDDALLCFQRETDANSAGSAAERCNNLLNIALVLTAKGSPFDLKVALKYIDNAQALVDQVVPDHVNVIEEKKLRYDLRKRIITRSAHIRYLLGEVGTAIDLYDSYRKFDKRQVKRDIAHCLIATLCQEGPSQDFDRAMQICITNIFENTSKGNQHEALGFRIALAHLFRKRGQLLTGEACLDLVYEDLVEYGCSERTYLYFLLEAGRNLLQQGNAPRAYVGYLKPCFERAKSRNIFRITERAKTYALEALHSIQSRYEAVKNRPTVDKEIEKQLRDRHNNFTRKKSSYITNVSVDPLASYAVISEQNANLVFESKATIEAEIRYLRTS